MEQANNADDGTDRASEENTETVNFKPLDFKKIQEKIRENLRIEYIIIIILAGILLFLIAEKEAGKFYLISSSRSLIERTGSVIPLI